jgi:amidophosphoribosyltransferase
VRGTTTRTRIRAIREAGAREVHMRVTCPPLQYPCCYGIDFPSADELVASGRKVDEVAQFLGLDSLGYLSLGGMLDCMGQNKDCFCTACYTGVYPIDLKGPFSKDVFETHLTRTLQ